MLYDLVEITQKSDSLGVYRRRLSNGKTARTTLSAERREYTVSSDGRLLAWAAFTDTSTGLFVARPESLRSARRIVSTSDYISSVLWSTDGSAAVFYTTAPRGEAGGPERLYSIQMDGTRRRLIATLGNSVVYDYRTLLAHNTQRNELVWHIETREGAGASRGLFVTNVATGKTRSRGLAQRRGFGTVAITADGTKIYVVRDGTRVIERTVFTNAERVLYRAKSPRELALEYLNVTPDGSVLVFQATEDSFFGPTSNADRPRTTTYRVLLPGGSPRAVNVEDRKESHLTVEGISPDGNFVMLRDTDSKGDDILLDLATKRRTIIAGGGSERTVFLLGWISLPT